VRKENRRVPLAALASLAIVMVAISGCAGSRHPALRAELLDCSSLAGVFHNVGSNDLDPERYPQPHSLREFLLADLVTTDELSPRFIKGHDVSVAIKHVGRGVLKFAVLDGEGSVVKRGTYSYYESCSKGVLEKRWKEDVREDGYFGSDQTNRHYLFVSVDGKLVVSRMTKYFGVFVVLPVIGSSTHWGEFGPDPRYDVRAIDF